MKRIRKNKPSQDLRTCEYCGKTLRAQGYGPHLRLGHPKEWKATSGINGATAPRKAEQETIAVDEFVDAAGLILPYPPQGLSPIASVRQSIAGLQQEHKRLTEEIDALEQLRAQRETIAGQITIMEHALAALENAPMATRAGGIHGAGTALTHSAHE